MGQSKATMEEIREELEQGKELSDIAEKFGYSSIHPISDKINGNGSYSHPGFYVLNKFTKTGEKGRARLASFKEDEIREAGFDPDKDLYFHKVVEDGEIRLVISENRVEDEVFTSETR